MKMLEKEKTLQVVRVYAKELELVDFPLPYDKVTKRNQADLDPDLKDISLHHIIRK